MGILNGFAKNPLRGSLGEAPSVRPPQPRSQPTTSPASHVTVDTFSRTRWAIRRWGTVGRSISNFDAEKLPPEKVAKTPPFPRAQTLGRKHASHRTSVARPRAAGKIPRFPGEPRERRYHLTHQASGMDRFGVFLGATGVSSFDFEIRLGRSPVSRSLERRPGAVCPGFLRRPGCFRQKIFAARSASSPGWRRITFLAGKNARRPLAPENPAVKLG
jgi:hypothetical protein